MKLINLVITATLGCLLSLYFAIPAVALKISDLDNPQITEAFVDGLVIPLMKNHDSPSGVVAIVKGGKLVFARGYGYRDVARHIPVQPDRSLFRPGSISKLFTWVSVMQLVEQGKLDLDVDINRYLKTFRIRDTYPGQPVTMRHIMTHTAGFEDGFLGYLIIDDPSRIMPLAQAMKKYQSERVNPPGKQTAYSNYGAALAGLVVANISGMEFADYVQKNIFDVLGMKSSSFREPLPDDLNKNMVSAYAFKGGKYVEKPFEIISNFAPAGASSVTATDEVKFAQAILNGGEYEGGRILKPETVTQMLTRNFTHDDRMMGMALGFYETGRNGLRLVGHGGDTIYFHSDLVIDQKNDLAYFVSFGGGGGSIVRSAFMGAFYDAFYPQEKKKIIPPSDFSARAGKYAGTYLFWRSSFSKIEKLLMLVGGISVKPMADNTLLMALGGKASRYAETDKNLFQEINGSGKIAFQENDKGLITGFVKDGLPFMSTFKAPFYYTGGFNFFLLGFSTVVFLGVLLRLAYQWSGYRAFSGANKKAARAAVMVAAANVLTLVIGGLVMIAVGDQMFSKIPLLFKIWLFFPIVASLAGLYLLYQTIVVWKDGLCSGLWARLRYSVVTAGALFMIWFYTFWNILGFHYLA